MFETGPLSINLLQDGTGETARSQTCFARVSVSTKRCRLCDGAIVTALPSEK